MRKKGYRKIESPEKMPVITTGIQMSRSDPKSEGMESHRGANAAADESLSAKLVSDFITAVK